MGGVTIGELDLTGNVAVVAGGAKGVGRLLTEVLTAAGAAVAIIGRTPETLNTTAGAVRRDGATVLPIDQLTSGSGALHLA